MAELPKLERKEWEAMMVAVLSDAILTEIPDNHPADGGPVVPTDPQRNDDDNSPDVTDEIPAGGGFETEQAPTPDLGKVSTEIPADGPTVTNVPPNKAPTDHWRVGQAATPVQTQQVIYAAADAKTGWGTTSQIIPMSKVVSSTGGSPTATSNATGPDASPTKTVATPAMVRGRDVTGPVSSDVAMQDGTFMTLNLDDLKNNIDKVVNADKTKPDSQPWYVDIKRHLMNRAADLNATHLIPANWNMAMASLAENEMAKDFSMEERKKMAGEHKALPNLSYPIETVKDLHNAIDLARSGHGDVTAAKALIRKRAKALGVALPADMK